MQKVQSLDLALVLIPSDDDLTCHGLRGGASNWFEQKWATKFPTFDVEPPGWNFYTCGIYVREGMTAVQQHKQYCCGPGRQAMCDKNTSVIGTYMRKWAKFTTHIPKKEFYWKTNAEYRLKESFYLIKHGSLLRFFSYKAVWNKLIQEQLYNKTFKQWCRVG